MADHKNVPDHIKKVWLQFPDESEEQYKNFVKYYLPMKDGRSVLGAYRTYLMEERGKAEDYVKGIGSAPHRWLLWSRGMNNAGDPIEGCPTWDERARLYWEMIYSDELTAIIERRGQMVEAEYYDGVGMLQQWNDLYFQFVEEIRQLKENSIKLGKNFDSTPYIRKLRDIVKSRDEIAAFLRRSVGMLDKVTEDALAVQMANKKEVKVEWIEPEAKAVFDDVVDNLSEEDFEKLLKNDLQGYS